MIEVRYATEADLGWICELERMNFSLPWTREQLKRQLGGEGHCLFAAELDGQAAGYMGLDWVLDEGYVTNVCTSGRFRRRGVGGALIDAAANRARELGLAFVSLEVRASNSPAIALYAAKGFETDGVRPGYYEKPREDAVIMTLHLKEVEL